MTHSMSEMSHLYRKESDPKRKERLFLILRVKGDSVIPTRAAKELHRSRTWASEWLARYDGDGIMDSKISPRLADHLNFLKKFLLR